MFKQLFILLAFTSAINACAFKTRYEITIDNPTAQKMTVWVDNQEIPLDTFQFKILWLPEGAHVMKYKDSSFTFALANGDNKLLINPTHSRYLMDIQVYRKDPYGKGHTVTPSLEKSSQLFIRGNWNYNVKEELPNMSWELTKKEYQAKSEIRFVKLWRGHDFIYGDGSRGDRPE